MAFRRLTKEQMVKALKSIQSRNWIRSIRPLNSGGIGNTLDSLLGLPENNLPIADTAQWELKTHRVDSSALLTLFHMEPEPRSHKIVVNLLLPQYGWPDQHGRPQELSFRQTLQATRPTDRGFGISVDRGNERVIVYFDARKVQPNQADWLQNVKSRIGLDPLAPQPYWSFRSLFLKASTKLLNSFYILAETKKQMKEEYFRIQSLHVLQGFDIDRFVLAIETGNLFIDFDARTHHNHGTKFRLKQDSIPSLYRYVDKVP
ncbi:MAG: MvaI/BcnI restriction endonuclease family protein [Chloroflexi bacterium]|nr:MvaI/BcnI restriction endonuclease family protein [Chloroflexota bacterium]